MYDSTDPHATRTVKRTRRWPGRYNGKHRQPDELSADELLETLMADPRSEIPGSPANPSPEATG